MSRVVILAVHLLGLCVRMLEYWGMLPATGGECCLILRYACWDHELGVLAPAHLMHEGLAAMAGESMALMQCACCCRWPSRGRS